MSSVKNPMMGKSGVESNDQVVGSGVISSHSENLPGKPPEHPPFATYINMICIFSSHFSFALALSISTVAIYVYVPLGMSIIWISQVGIITSCINIPLVLYFSSMSDSLTGKWARWGRRKPFVAASVIPTVISSIMFAYPNDSNQAAFDYGFLIAVVIFSLSPALFFIPFKAWMIESCSSPAEYTSINGVQMLASLFGGIIGQFVITGVSDPSNPFGGARIVAWISVIALPLSVFALCWIVPSRELQKAPVQPPIISSFRQCIRTKEFQTIFWNETLTQMGSRGTEQFTFPILYLFFGLGHTNAIHAYYGPTLFAVLVGSVACILGLTWFLKRYEKVLVYKIILLIVILIGFGTVIILIPGIMAYKVSPPLYTPKQEAVNIVIFLGFVAIAAMVGVCMTFCQALLVRDLITFDTFTTGLNRESMYQTAISVPAGLLASIWPNVLNGILYSTGFETKKGPKSADPYISETYGWNKGTLYQITFYVLLFSCVIGFGAYFLMKDYSLTTAVAAKMEAINLKNEEKKKVLVAAINADEDVYSIEESSSGKSAENLTTDEVATYESNLMNHFSQLENMAMKEASIVGGHNEAMNRMKNSMLLGGAVLGPLAMISLITGAIYQIKNDSPFTTLCLTCFSIAMMYEGYEVFRYRAIQELYAMPNDVMTGMVKRAVERNSKYTLNLKEALAKADIDENEHDDTIPDDDHIVSRLTLTKKATKKSIVDAPELDDEKHPLSGYKRIFAACVVGIILGILCAVQKP